LRIADCGLRIADSDFTLSSAADDSRNPQSAIRNPQSNHFSNLFLVNSISEKIAIESAASTAAIAFAPSKSPSLNLV
jgi:hypothetical protein